ncbi:MAG TPA: hypothetical protein VFV31_00360 [Chitinophagaceae bacterium]|nr:hypothetical protein [Chitinophagaceae bacterium]
MTVYCNSGFSEDIKEKNFYIAKFLGGMIYHFQNLEFGDSVKEIVHYMACGPESFLFSHGIGMSYGRRNRGLSSLFTISYEKVKDLSEKPLLDYVSSELLIETDKLGQIKPKKFDLTAYKNSLTDYLADSINIVTSGGDPSSNKILNKDIQEAMWKKFSRL